MDTSSSPRAARKATVLIASGAGLATSALAHEGHGLGAGSHWHATDVLGFVGAALAIAAVAWWRGRK